MGFEFETDFSVEFGGVFGGEGLETAEEGFVETERV